MSWYEWFPAISTSALLGVGMSIAWLLLRTRLKESVRHEFEGKIESLRTELRKSEESYKAELRASETEIEALQSGALSRMASRQSLVDKRTMAAAELLWKGVSSLSHGKQMSSMLSRLHFEEALKEAEHNVTFRETFFAMYGKAFDAAKTIVDVKSARLYVSPISWAFYAAYESIVVSDILRVSLFQAGVNMPKLVDAENAAKLIKAALPGYSSYVDEHGPAGFYYLLDELETKLLDEIQKMIRGVEADRESVAQASAILKVVAETNKSAEKSETAPPPAPAA